VKLKKRRKKLDDDDSGRYAIDYLKVAYFVAHFLVTITITANQRRRSSNECEINRAMRKYRREVKESAPRIKTRNITIRKIRRKRRKRRIRNTMTRQRKSTKKRAKLRNSEEDNYILETWKNSLFFDSVRYFRLEDYVSNVIFC
jgi:hypothetical protein